MTRMFDPADIERAFVTNFPPFLSSMPASTCSDYSYMHRARRRRSSSTSHHHAEEHLGREQAMAHAGPWPVSGTIDQYRIATDRAVRAAHRAHAIEYRWNQRFRLWEHHEEPLVELHTTRLMARKELSVTIAEEREYLLRRLCEAPRGRA